MKIISKENNMTNFEKIKSLSVEGLSGWLDVIISKNIRPWKDWFNKEYCDKCEPEYIFHEWGGVDFPISFCEQEGYCKFFPYSGTAIETRDIIEMWLNREVGE
jgi:hypothetical protein